MSVYSVHYDCQPVRSVYLGFVLSNRSDRNREESQAYDSFIRQLSSAILVHYRRSPLELICSSYRDLDYM